MRNGVHEQVQQLEVVQRSILKLAPIAHTNVNREIEMVHAEFAVWVLVIPTIVRYERREGRHGDVMTSEIEDRLRSIDRGDHVLCKLDRDHTGSDKIKSNFMETCIYRSYEYVLQILTAHTEFTSNHRLTYAPGMM